MIYEGKYKRMELFENLEQLTCAQIKAKTGCDMILNGVLFNSDGSLCADNKINGKWIADDITGDFKGIAWSDKKSPIWCKASESSEYDNFVSAFPVADNYCRGRTALGFKGDTYKLLCVSDGFGAMSIADVDREMADCDFYTYLDGGGSSCCMTPKGKITSTWTRETQNRTYILIWEVIQMRKYKVCLDPGHGIGEMNQSPDGQYFEYMFAWDMSNRIQELLEGTGKIEVKLTKAKKSETPSLTYRANVANNWGADVFVSIHSNAVGAGQWKDNVHGLTAWTYAQGGKRDVLANTILEEMAERDVELFGSKLYHSHFTVLAKSNMPAVLIEHLFHTCHSDVEKLLNNEYRDTFAHATAAAVLRYFELDETLLTEDEEILKNEVEVLKDVIYRVQVGAFTDENNAESMQKLLEGNGYSTIIKEETR